MGIIDGFGSSGLNPETDQRIQDAYNMAKQALDTQFDLNKLDLGVQLPTTLTLNFLADSTVGIQNITSARLNISTTAGTFDRYNSQFRIKSQNVLSQSAATTGLTGLSVGRPTFVQNTSVAPSFNNSNFQFLTGRLFFDAYIRNFSNSGYYVVAGTYSGATLNPIKLTGLYVDILDGLPDTTGMLSSINGSISSSAIFVATPLSGGNAGTQNQLTIYMDNMSFDPA